MPFELEVIRTPDMTILRCRGRLVLEHGAAPLGEVARQELSRGQDVALDLGAVTQMDARGTGVLAELCGIARARRCLLGLAGVSDRVQRLLRLTLLDTVIPDLNVLACPRAAVRRGQDIEGVITDEELKRC